MNVLPIISPALNVVDAKNVKMFREAALNMVIMMMDQDLSLL